MAPITPLSHIGLITPENIGAQPESTLLSAIAAIVPAGSTMAIGVTASGAVTLLTPGSGSIGVSSWNDLTDKPATLVQLGVNGIQPLSPQLSAIAALSGTGVLNRTGLDSYELLAIADFVKTLLNSSNATAFRSTLGAQAAASNLSALAALSPVPNRIFGTNASGDLVMVDLSGSGNGDMLQSQYDPDGDGKVAAAEVADSANAVTAGSVSGLAAVATSGSYDDLANLPTLGALATLEEIANTQIAAAAAIEWSKINKAGATATDVGAEAAGAVATHEAASGSHDIAAVSGLQSALDERVERATSGPQALETAFTITPADLAGSNPIPNLGGNSHFSKTLTENTVIQNPINAPTAPNFGDYTFMVIGDGSSSLDWGTAYRFPGGEPAWGMAAGDVNIASFRAYDGAMILMGVLIAPA